MSIASFGLVCSSCNHVLLNATIISDADMSQAVEKDIIFNEVDMICSGCNGRLQMVEDDLTRDIKAYWEALG